MHSHHRISPPPLPPPLPPSPYRYKQQQHQNQSSSFPLSIRTTIFSFPLNNVHDPGEIRGFSPRIPAAGPPPREERVGAAEDAAEPLAAAAAAAAVGTPLPLESAPAPGSLENLKLAPPTWGSKSPGSELKEFSFIPPAPAVAAVPAAAGSVPESSPASPPNPAIDGVLAGYAHH